jgi:hypothetical protein
MDWEYQLISVYLFVCIHHQKTLKHFVQRMSNNADLSFTDEEVITIYLCGLMDKRHTLKEIYVYADRHLRGYFPLLPSYVAFVQRINIISGVFIPLVEILTNQCSLLSNTSALLVDAMPIILAQRGRRFTAKVAPDLAHKNGYCATKKLFYYGVKLHIFGRKQKGTLPLPELVGITPANIGDREAFDMAAASITDEEVYGDKAYALKNDDISKLNNITLLTPIKKQKGQKYLDAADQLFSTAVSRVRQPIESLFNWLEQKSGIQMASKVRSSQGLIAHIFGRLCAALWLMPDLIERAREKAI